MAAAESRLRADARHDAGGGLDRCACSSLPSSLFARRRAGRGSERPSIRGRRASSTPRPTRSVRSRSCCAEADFAAGWKLDPPAKTNPPCTAGPDESNFVQTAKVDPSFTWKDHVTNVGSEVDIFRTAADARSDWRASTPSLLGDVPAAERARRVSGRRCTCGIVSTRRSPAPKGVERGLHYRFVFGVPLHETDEPRDRRGGPRPRPGDGRPPHADGARTAPRRRPSTALTGVLAARLNATHGGITA